MGTAIRCKGSRARRAYDYVVARTLPGKWVLLDEGGRRYARHLVKDLGWGVDLAIQHTHIFGWQEWTYDKRAHSAVREAMDRSEFWR